MFRELGYGVLFFISSMAGASLGVVAALPFHRMIDENPHGDITVLAVGGFIGAIVGAGIWRDFKRVVLVPPKKI